MKPFLTFGLPCTCGPTWHQVPIKTPGCHLPATTDSIRSARLNVDPDARGEGGSRSRANVTLAQHGHERGICG
jgi:hypothetical protein